MKFIISRLMFLELQEKGTIDLSDKITLELED